jgi:THO complex subunit 5
MSPITISLPETSLPPPPITDHSILNVRDTISQINVVTNRLLRLRFEDDLTEDEVRQYAMDEKKLANLKIMLRGFNREMYLQNRAVKTVTSETKAEFDNLYLQLQNLAYEQQHLRSEIQDCRNYV